MSEGGIIPGPRGRHGSDGRVERRLPVSGAIFVDLFRDEDDFC